MYKIDEDETEADVDVEPATRCFFSCSTHNGYLGARNVLEPFTGTANTGAEEEITEVDD